MHIGMSKDWTGNTQSVFKCLGSSHHTADERQPEDYYATDPKAAHLLLEVESFEGGGIWEPACGEKHLAMIFEERGYDVRSSDIVNRCGNEVLDFLSFENQELWHGHIITNPPYKSAVEFIYKALSLIPKGYKVAMFLKVTFLEGKSRKALFKEFPPKIIYVSSSRINCGKNGDFSGMRETGGSAIAYAWYVWEKGYKGNTIVKWIN